MIFPVLYEDAAILAIAKPAGVCVIPPRTGDPGECVRAWIERARGARIYVVHRLDRDTSGVLLLAKTAPSHKALNDAFAARLVRKTYLALVDGSPPDTAGRIDHPLRAGRRGRMRIARPDERGALPSVTRFRVLEQFSSRDGKAVASLLELEPITGRTHQLRVHASAAHVPILGDPIYAPADVRARAPRLMLHAARVELPALCGDPARVIEAPPPSDFEAALASLRDAR